jgi:hypothetical protein
MNQSQKQMFLKITEIEKNLNVIKELLLNPNRFAYPELEISRFADIIVTQANSLREEI